VEFFSYTSVLSIGLYRKQAKESDGKTTQGTVPVGDFQEIVLTPVIMMDSGYLTGD
tara:strand:+ start:422 stop:589 length:168 start_codon:yes stop_codon:yes gene_type:complete